MTAQTPTKGKRIGLFATCLVNTMRPRVGFAALKLLEDAGYDVAVPADQTCCGQPNYNSGDRESARDFARRFIQQFSGFDFVVVPSGSCAAMVKVHYPKLFEEDEPERVAIETIAARTHELVSFLIDVAGIGRIEASHATSVTYHDACSGLRELRIKQQPRTLLNSIDGLELKEMEDAEVCCGFGGLFCVKYPDVSGEMVRKKSEEIIKTEAEAIVTGDVGCLLNIEGALSRRGEKTRAYHVAEVLAGFDKEDAS